MGDCGCQYDNYYLSLSITTVIPYLAWRGISDKVSLTMVIFRLVAIVTVERDEGAGFQGINEEALHGGNGRILKTEVIRFQVRSRTEWTASTLLVPRKDWK